MEMANNPDEGTGLSVADVTANIEKLWDSESGTTESVDADNGSETAELEAAETTEDESTEEQPEADSEGEQSEEAETAESKDEEKQAAEQAARENEVVFEVGGKQITRKQAQQGFMFQSDYTRKTQELKQHMARYQVQEQGRDEYRVGLEQSLNLMRAQLAQAVELVEMPSDELLAEDGQAYLIQQRKYERQQAAFKHMHEQHVGVQAKIEQSRIEQHAIKQANAREEFIGMHPEFGGPNADALWKEVAGDMLKRGYTAERINNIDDALMMSDAYELHKFRKAAANVPEAVKHFEKKPPLIQPGTAKTSTSTQSDASKRSLQKLKQTGSVSDMQAYVESLWK